ncbi:N-acetylmuramic acid 6-phosphate etherase [Psychromonas sp. 14N.309.X.WAT.B.A12]|uniref:N-acetylmuramic acid 6-phosphate etherase n=1 Tax=unclassified Psychromonas TaxID=2614957 RepID=UPI0025AEED5A|nr:N-acetylmuramic acid 6-phosphate etherase [Psychromonas sp. 14N.309.X.WAT.B.A12]MDN2662451.1 N-acetylmuramic acid 6-phosphate etherase [Psychromonas sp. 14N.309.X.WAT.B.A12]
MSLQLQQFITESRNQASTDIDIVSTETMLTIINNEDKKVALAVERILPAIAQAVDLIQSAFSQGGRLIYCGAGTSGRLGILDASECPPTFGSPAEQVIGLIAGGNQAILKAVENAEDNQQAGQQDLVDIKLISQDVVVGIAASGRTPYVIGAMQYAQQQGCKVISLTCNDNSTMAKIADVPLEVIVGPEVVTGSSRLKAGTAQKMVLNMLSTGAMIKSGKVFGNLMVDVQATNAKLIERQKKIIMEATECSRETAELALEESGNHCKTAIVMILTGVNAQQAKNSLQQHQGFIRECI